MNRVDKPSTCGGSTMSSAVQRARDGHEVFSVEMKQLPSGACDCHVHVFGPASRYPWDAARGYTPAHASLESLQALHRSLGIERMVIVQPSPYGSDNRCTLDAIARLGGTGRGIAVVDESITTDELQRLHAAGVRGIRINLESQGQHDPQVGRRALTRAAEQVAPLGWHVQTFTNLAMLSALADLLRDLPVPLVVDHMGRADAAKGVDQPGFDTLLEGVASGRVYVKLSAPYRVSKQTDYPDAAAIATALIDANPDRVLWGSDWPHPGSAAGVPMTPHGITPFRGEDDDRALQRALEWAGTQDRIDRLLVHNPARLYDF
jgi:predicted TIM-barrel fold metal-dependent hydrolase